MSWHGSLPLRRGVYVNRRRRFMWLISQNACLSSSIPFDSKWLFTTNSEWWRGNNLLKKCTSRFSSSYWFLVRDLVEFFFFFFFLVQNTWIDFRNTRATGLQRWHSVFRPVLSPPEHPPPSLKKRKKRNSKTLAAHLRPSITTMRGNVQHRQLLIETRWLIAQGLVSWTRPLSFRLDVHR